jgi:hypothetical protein
MALAVDDRMTELNLQFQRIWAMESSNEPMRASTDGLHSKRPTELHPCPAASSCGVETDDAYQLPAGCWLFGQAVYLADLGGRARQPSFHHLEQHDRLGFVHLEEPMSTIRGSSFVPCRGSPSLGNHAAQSDAYSS